MCGLLLALPAAVVNKIWVFVLSHAILQHYFVGIHLYRCSFSFFLTLFGFIVGRRNSYVYSIRMDGRLASFLYFKDERLIWKAQAPKHDGDKLCSLGGGGGGGIGKKGTERESWSSYSNHAVSPSLAYVTMQCSICGQSLHTLHWGSVSWTPFLWM